MSLLTIFLIVGILYFIVSMFYMTFWIVYLFLKLLADMFVGIVLGVLKFIIDESKK